MSLFIHQHFYLYILQAIDFKLPNFLQDFAVGRGDDKDLPKVTFIMDSKDYPSFVAEQYHQFHDGFNFGENYPNSYNSLAATFAKKGEDFGRCPNGMLGVGVGGL